VRDGSVASISRSEFAGNGDNIVAVGSFAGASTTVNVTDVAISGGFRGVAATSSAPGARSSTVAGNAFGYFQSGRPSVVKSLGNNYIDENGTDSGSLAGGSLR